MGIADPADIAIRAAMVLSSPQEPCCRSSKRKSMPDWLKTSAAAGEPKPSPKPKAGLPSSIICLAVLSFIIDVYAPFVLCPTSLDYNHLSLVISPFGDPTPSPAWKREEEWDALLTNAPRFGCVCT